MTLWELMWADARRQLLQRRSRARVPEPVASADPAPAAVVIAATDDADDPKAALRRAAAAKDAARMAAAEDEEADFLAAAFSELFVHFVAAVAIGMRRRVLDECADPDDAMRLFHSVKGVDFWEAVQRAHVLRAASAGRKNR
jgi:hypothetical protein